MGILGKKLIIYMGIIIGVVVLVFILLAIFGGKKTYDYPAVVDTLTKSATRYFEENKEMLPKTDGGYNNISGNELVEKGYMKEISELIGKEIVCNADVKVTSRNGGYQYTPTLICGNEYSTEKLSNTLIKTAVTSGDGLYQMSGDYVYRGEVINNYITFGEGNRLWRILSVDAEGNLKLLREPVTTTNVWDDRYNTDQKANLGINDYPLSRAREYLDALYADEGYFTANQKAYMLSQQLCVGGRTAEQTGTNGQIECAKTYPNQLMGIISLHEYLRASLSPTCASTQTKECQNYNYLAPSTGIWWTLTKDSGSTYRVYVLDEKGVVKYASTELSFMIRPTIVLSKDVIYKSGDGSKTNPYMVR